MATKSKNIILFLFLLVGLIILAHSIIPHDHHYNTSDYLAHHDSENTDDSLHCFLFNNIIVDKIVVVLNINILNFISFFQQTADHYTTFFRNLVVITFCDDPLFTYSAQLVANCPSRGSPQFI